MSVDKAKQLVGLIGGFLGTVYLFLQSIGIEFAYFNQQSIDSFANMLNAMIPLVFISYGIYKNSYVITQKARKQEKELQKQGMK